MSGSPHQPPSPAISTPSLHSVAADSIPPVSIVITTPPWARDEPPSPKDSSVERYLSTERRPSDVASYNTSVSDINSRWWTFTLPRPVRPLPLPEFPSPGSPPVVKSERRSFRDLSWLPTSTSMREGTSFIRNKEKDIEATQPMGSSSKRDWGLSVTLPTAPPAPYTVSHNVTPGWDSPWSPRTAVQGPGRLPIDDNSYDPRDLSESRKSTSVRRRRKKFRAFILTNIYVPLLFRFICITFTSAALGLAIRIRRMEQDGNAMGAVGSSITVVIMFAPLTLVHVMVSIYLEYFGRPLGLWRTSGKLAHTLSEVLFICAWSSALSLCFDNYFTSLVPCASPSSTSWYNELPRPPSPIPSLEGQLGDQICDNQLALTCLVGVGLSIYCINLVIDLFRIFEKVKYHPAASLRP